MHRAGRVVRGRDARALWPTGSGAGLALLEGGGPGAAASPSGPTGYVLATDIDPAWLDPRGAYEVRQHDVAADPPPEPGTFDLVHARLVLVHVPDRARALATIDAHLAAAGELDLALAPLISAWGRRPDR